MTHRLLIIVAAATVGFVTMGPAAAQRRPDSLSMSCRSVQALVARSGAMVIGSGPHIYDRFVADRRFCAVTQITRPAWIRSADTASCFVGYTCEEPSSDDFFWRD